jgi:RNA polymerase sigma factor (sigma-70 family)
MVAFREESRARIHNESEALFILLDRMRASPDDRGVWAQFVMFYERAIYGWCRRWGLQHADAEDVTQEVFLKLSVRMRTFCYDPQRSFRAWLKKVAQRECQHYLVKQRKAGQAGGGEFASQRLDVIEARVDRVQRMEEAFDKERLKQAAARVQLRVDPKTWDAFHMLAVQGCRGVEVAKHLDMEVGTVFVARSRAQRMLREELTRLEQLYETSQS